ncbi:MAG: DNA-3-methyladenine glycosylase I [Bryobacteraceae bacterium]
MERQGRLTQGPDGRWRCWWCGADADYMAYHDSEWGVPVHDDIRLFEKICLEGFQAGLSWLTILRKREAFRRAFAGFDFRVLAGWGEAEIERLMREPGIIRHRGKIASVLNNARRACELADKGDSLAGYLWSFAGRPPRELARELKRRGWTFVGPTTIESLMQAVGMVDAHEPGCWRRGANTAARRPAD